MNLIDGIYDESIDNSFEISKGLVAGSAPMYPPNEWFQDPGLKQATPITITDDGRIYGHIATWDSDHTGLPPGTKPPRSASDYAFFRTGGVKTAEGDIVPVGQLTLAGGHAPINASAGAAVAHYDDTNTTVADLAAGEDTIGIWVNGGLRPGVTESEIRALRASAPSGDWRPINGQLDLVAVCQVNTPGFPVARAMVASGEVTALVAAGAHHMFQLQQERMVLEGTMNLEHRVFELESIVAAAGLPFKKKDEESKSAAEPEDDDKPSDKSDVPEAAAPEEEKEEAPKKDHKADAKKAALKKRAFGKK